MVLFSKNWMAVDLENRSLLYNLGSTEKRGECEHCANWQHGDNGQK